MLLGLVLMGSTLFFATVGAVAAQLSTSPALARGLGFTTLGVLFVIAAVGEVTHNYLVWFSPFGWARYAQAFATNRFWVPLIPVAMAGLLAWLALKLANARDLGTGLLPSRPGRSVAPGWLRNPPRARLASGQRLPARLVCRPRSAGRVDGIDHERSRRPTRQSHLPRLRAGTAAALSEMFFLFVLYVLAQIATAAVLAAVLRLRTDETDRLAGPLLAQPMTRTASGRFAADHRGRYRVRDPGGGGRRISPHFGQAHPCSPHPGLPPRDPAPDRDRHAPHGLGTAGSHRGQLDPPRPAAPRRFARRIRDRPHLPSSPGSPPMLRPSARWSAPDSHRLLSRSPSPRSPWRRWGSLAYDAATSNSADYQPAHTIQQPASHEPSSRPQQAL